MSINLNLNFKARIYETLVGCQCWRSRKRTKDKHLALEMGWLGKILGVFTLCFKKRHWCSVAHYNFNAHQPILVFLAEALPRECAIKWWLVIPPFLTYVSALHGETRTPEIMSFQSCCIPCLENDTALACYVFDMHQLILIFFVDNKVVLLSTVCTYYFSPSHLVFETHAWLKRHIFQGSCFPM